MGDSGSHWRMEPVRDTGCSEASRPGTPSWQGRDVRVRGVHVGVSAGEAARAECVCWVSRGPVPELCGRRLGFKSAFPAHCLSPSPYPLGLLFLDGSGFLPDISGPSCPLGSVMSSVSICRREESMGRWPEFPHWPVTLQGRAGTCRVLWTGALLSDQAQQGERASSEELYNLFYPL